MKKIVLFCLAAVIMLSCTNDDKLARLEIRLTDAPGDYEEVNIDIAGVEVHSDGAGDDAGWTSLNANTGVYNILELAGGLDTLLCTAELPAGKISQIRLLLGNNNSLVLGGEKFPLSTPSGQQSGLKLNVHTSLTEGITYKMTLDFDAARSVVSKGNGSYSLKPVIRVVSEATSGAIKGTVIPVESTPAVYAILASGDTAATAYTNFDGAFLLRGLEAGTYSIRFSPKEGYAIAERAGVVVTTGQVTDLGVVTIEH